VAISSAEAGVGGEYPPATVNGGHFGVVSGELGARLLRRAWQVYPAPKPDRWWEQSALIYLFGGERAECRKDIRAFDCARHLAGELGSHVTTLNSTVLNAPPWAFEQGADLILHTFGDDVLYTAVGGKATMLAQVLAFLREHEGGDLGAFLRRFCSPEPGRFCNVAQKGPATPTGRQGQRVRIAK